jgi:hypothetical protein
MFAGYVINGMKLVYNLNFLIKMIKLFFIKKVKEKKKFSFIFSLKIIYLVFLEIINKIQI